MNEKALWKNHSIEWCQRLEEVAPDLHPVADACSVEFLKKAKVTTTPLDTGHVPLDCDVSPIDNSKTKGAEDLEYDELGAGLHH